MLAVVTIISVLVAGLVFYALYRSRLTRFRLAFSVLRLIWINIEVESDRPCDELPPGGRPRAMKD